MKTKQLLSPVIVFSFLLSPVQAQKKGLESITAQDLKKHMLFLASDELQGRNTGEPGMNIAARYLAVQAEQLGLKSADPENGYIQHYVIQEKAYDLENSYIAINRTKRDPVINNRAFYILPAVESDQVLIEGEVVFAGYGINDQAHHYNDFDHVDIQGKVVLIMNRGPMNEEGTEAQFDNDKWNSMQNFQYKMQAIYEQQPKAVILVFDPKSGISSIEDINPGIARYLGKSRSLKPADGDLAMDHNRPHMVLAHRSVADQLLAGSGKSLEALQMEIDRDLSPRSFLLEGTTIRIELNMDHKELEVSNVFGLIEGSDPVLRDEVVLYMAHFDHVGTDGEGGVFNGADDNASGTVALIEIAEAFQIEKKRPRRSVGILWVSAEEVGLFGSSYFVDHPLVPLKNIVAAINLDMVGRTKTIEDEASSGSELSIVGFDSVKVIGGLQSSVLMEINKKTLDEMGLKGNYAYNDLHHPGNYFYRSDHINFARKDIPVLFYSTGTHRDYHKITDEEKLIDYAKFLRMTRFGYKVGYNVAQYRDAIEIDNPMSGW